MIRGVYCIRDEASGLYMQPTVEINSEVAMRNFDFAMERNDMMHFRPADYSLWHIGDFDDKTGVLDARDP